MTELEKVKHETIHNLQHLCARCRDGLAHDCPVAKVIREVAAIHGVPVIVNSQLRHVVFI